MLVEFKDENMELIKRAFADIKDSLNNLDWTRIDNILTRWIEEGKNYINTLAFPSTLDETNPTVKFILKNFLLYKIYLRIGDSVRAREILENFVENTLERIVNKQTFFNGFVIDGIKWNEIDIN